MIENVVIADDLTGALETGCLLSGAGAETRVLLGRQSLDGWADGAVVFDVESRHLSAAAAAACVTAAARPAAATGAGRFYLKVDSTMRGPIGSELGAFLRAWPDCPLVFAPSYPHFGRVVRDGRVFVNGTPLEETEFARDRFEPARAGGIVEMIRGECAAPVVGVANAEELRERLARDEGASLYVCDAGTDQELRELRQVVEEQRRRVLLAGSGGFFRQWMDADGRGRARMEVQSGLFLSGSQHPASLTQIAYAEANGMTVYRMEDAAGDEVLLKSLAAALDRQGWAVVATPAADVSSGELGERVGRLVRVVLAKSPVESLTVFGGDTTHHVLGGLGVDLIRPVGELLAGIPISKIAAGGRELPLVTKAGGFGDAETVLRIREAMGGGR